MDPTSVQGDLESFLRSVWLLATLLHGSPITDTDHAPEVTFRPGIADRGTWGCSVYFKANESLIWQVSGSLDSCHHQISGRIHEYLYTHHLDKGANTENEANE